MVDVFRCFVAYAFEVDGLATPVSEVGGYDDLCLSVQDPLTQRPDAESRVHHAMHRPNPGAGQHGYRSLGSQWHVYDHLVALPDPQAPQPIGHPVDQLGKPPVGEHLLRPVLPYPHEGRLIFAAVFQMPVQAVVSYVAFAVREPLEVGVVPFENPGPGFVPVQLRRHLRPEPLRVFRGAFVLAFVVLNVGVFNQPGRRLYLARLLQQMVDLSLLYHNLSPVQAGLKGP